VLEFATAPTGWEKVFTGKRNPHFDLRCARVMI